MTCIKAFGIVIYDLFFPFSLKYCNYAPLAVTENLLRCLDSDSLQRLRVYKACAWGDKTILRKPKAARKDNIPRRSFRANGETFDLHCKFYSVLKRLSFHDGLPFFQAPSAVNAADLFRVTRGCSSLWSQCVLLSRTSAKPDMFCRIPRLPLIVSGLLFHRFIAVEG